ncbi:MAG: hypothetical protein GDA35_01780, partial [Hyphomonadaceae bacterium]|nr:hypothetical protein [Hyphomonadaceae bacterium]
MNWTIFRNIVLASVAGLALAACGNGDNDILSPPAPPPPPPADTAAPEVSFSPATLDVDSGGTGSSTLTATDNVGVTTGPTVTCTVGSFADNTYTAPVVSADTMATCTATASDAAGNEGTATLTITVAREMTAPVVTFSPDTLDVASGATVALTATVMDDVDGDLVPEVTCTGDGTFDGDNNTYTAPVLSADTDLMCTATATDAAGNAGTATIAISVAAETEPPVITFTPATLDVASGATGMSTLAATDNLDDTVTPTVACTDGGSFANNTYTAPVVSADTMATCTATATDAAG